MRRILCLAVFALLPGLAAAGDADPRAVIERAIKAHGGADALTKALNCTRADTGLKESVGRQILIAGTVTRSLPDRVRIKVEFDKKITMTFVFDGAKGWQQDGDNPSTALPAARLKELREEAYVWWISTLVPLTKPGFTLTSLPKVKIDGEPAVGVKVAHKGHADTKMYFYERNGLLAKVERRTPEGGTMVDKEYLYGGFKEFDGVLLPTREVVNVNGSKDTTISISNYTFRAKFEAGTFARP